MELLKEKGIPVEKQNRSWSKIVQKAFNKTNVDCYTRARQILMNGIEVESWNFKHNFSRMCLNLEASKEIVNIRRIEDSQQTTINWLVPEDQSVLETTLGYEQVAVDLTAWLAQNEPDQYVKETFNFGLLEDFDHLYRYSQWYNMEEGKSPNHILQGKTDVTIGRPTQHHHNDNTLRIRKHYNKSIASPQTKVNILTVLSAEQQTHNYYAEHGFAYGNNVLRKTYAEIKDVEEEHVSMYESLIDPTESLYEKLLMHEFTEVCNYYTCYEDEVCDEIKKIWELFLDFELGHLQTAIKLFEKYERRDAQEVIGNKIIIPSRFKSQKEYVANVIENEVDKRLDEDCGFTIVDNLPQNWKSYKFQDELSSDGAPSEQTVRIAQLSNDRDIILSGDEFKIKEWEILEKGLQKQSLAPDTLGFIEYKELMMN